VAVSKTLYGCVKRVSQDAGRFVLRLIDVTQAVRFVDDYQVPRHGLNILGFAGGELVGADEHGSAIASHIERINGAILDGLTVGFGLKEAGPNDRICLPVPDATAYAGWPG
jgi:hypothetical protein